MTMATVSRTDRVIQNAKVALFFYCVNLILQFFSRKIFLDYLGAELLGLNTTIQNLLQFLNLAESGISAAVAFALYRPLGLGNKQEIIDIVSLQGWFYRRVGFIVIAGSVVLMTFFPWIFAKAQVPLVYAYGTFIAFLISALLGYFANYKMIVLSADQREYRVTIETQTVKILKVLFQVLVIWKLQYGYFYWMFFEVIASVIISVRLRICIKNDYPWLSSDFSRIEELKTKYSYLLQKIKQLFWHKLAYYVLSQTTPLVVYAFLTLTSVAMYGNYLVLVAGCQLFVDAVFKGFQAAVGNIVAEGDKKKIKTIYWEMVTIKLLLAGLFGTGLFLLSSSFIELWVGRQYVMQSMPVMLLSIIAFIQMSRVNEIFLSAYGLFKDTWAPIAEATINLGLSILFGYLWGISGIFLGVLISLLVIVICWKSYFLYSQGFQGCTVECIAIYLKKIFFVYITFMLTYLIYCYILNIEVLSFLDWLEGALIVVIIYLAICGLLFSFFDKDFERVLKRFKIRILI